MNTKDKENDKLKDNKKMRKTIEQNILSDYRIKDVSRTTLNELENIKIYDKDDIQKMDFYQHKALFHDAVECVTSLKKSQIKANKKKMIGSSLIVWTLSSALVAIATLLVFILAIWFK
ncbi:hypothetical protein [Mycoplasma sp. Mirounga ES2805-ORL]|uniref:hypothetical protein n=1 Tax=Mycoplasma sp. Mirounga ES2805-ORL TaxID=754514 RepID=UPI00197C4CA4|nr:hypothetical protein [Mycoplasma sp. Mirounga ES2805-ORL]QSF13840.1 hypothetical protein JXZ90_00870 [Mycoplasma sp. Mirounga ES2805-ORL]